LKSGESTSTAASAFSEEPPREAQFRKRLDEADDGEVLLVRDEAHALSPAAFAPDPECGERGHPLLEGREERARVLVAGDLARHHEELQRDTA